MGSTRQTQETARRYFLTDHRKWGKSRKATQGLRVIIDMCGLFVIRKDEEKPKCDEITIPGKLKYWPPALTNLRGLLLHGQEACNYFSFELANGRGEGPAQHLRSPLSRYQTSVKNIVFLPNRPTHAP